MYITVTSKKVKFGIEIHLQIICEYQEDGAKHGPIQMIPHRLIPHAQPQILKLHIPLMQVPLYTKVA